MKHEQIFSLVKKGALPEHASSENQNEVIETSQVENENIIADILGRGVFQLTPPRVQGEEDKYSEFTDRVYKRLAVELARRRSWKKSSSQRWRAQFLIQRELMNWQKPIA